MTLNELYDIADKNNISIVNYPFGFTKTVTVPGSIGIDIDLIGTIEEQKECIAIGLGHCLCNAFYTFDTIQKRDYADFLATEWAIKHLVPLDELNELFSNGIKTLQEISEHFGVTYQFVKKVVDYYMTHQKVEKKKMSKSEEGEEIGRKIEELREKKGYTQVELARKLKIAQSTVAMWETGKSVPKTKMLQTLAEILECSVDELLKEA